MDLASVDPATGAVLARHPAADPAAVDDAVGRAHAAFAAWRDAPFAERAAPLRQAAALLRERSARYADLMAAEMGKPVAQGRAEAEKCAWALEHYAEHAARYLADEPVATEATASYVAYRPLGVILAVMPWNFPLWQVVRFAAPTLMAGNTAVLKHASNVPGCALALGELLADAGLLPGVFEVVLAGSDAVAGLIADPRVRGVSLTGSTPAGRTVAEAAGRHLKPCVLELGGSDPYLVLGDADPEAAAALCARARLTNSGQSCIAAKRFVVVEAVRPAFEAALVARMAAARVGDPRDPATEVGPLARRDLRDDLHAQVCASVARGARLLLGGELPPGPGAFYPPTVLAGVAPGMPAYDEELFGPVAAVIRVADEAEAVRVANDTPFGLGAAVITADAARGERLAADALEAGACFVNAQVQSDPRLPFGGIGDSGFGRELGRHGILAFVNAKTVVVA